ncbi:MAG: biosynthetic arginine decarboxylase [Planctomycetota bacterium]
MSKKEMRAWTVQDSAELFNVSGWGQGFFSINAKGNVQVTPDGESGGAIDLKDLVDDLQQRGIQLPVLLRFSGILHNRIRALNECFNRAMKEAEFSGRYRGVYPIKVNQQRHVVEEMVEYGREYDLGLEAGSRPELLIAISLVDNPRALIICNGYKDAAYIETALLARKLGRQTILVIDRYEEVETILRVAEDLDIRPVMGVRAKLASRGAGRWQESGGEGSKFGLTSAELVAVVERLKEAKRLDCLELMHFHIGSQISDIRAIKSALREASRIFVELHSLGAPMKILDCGGGLGVDYDGSQTKFASSINYTQEEYANDVIYSVRDACDEKDVPHPDIITESGRALVAHHSVLIVNVLGVHKTVVGRQPEAPAEDEHDLVHSLHEVWREVTVKNFQESYHDALQIKEQSLSAFNLGILDLQDRGRIEDIFHAICERILRIVRELDYVPDEFDSLERSLADTFYCNFSVFQSMPDHWAVKQLFPILPIHALDRPLKRRGTIADLTCDSDGKVDRFIDLRAHKDCLELPDWDNGPLYLGVFLVGAYQEILGDLHNLFGDTDAVHVSLAENGYRLSHVVSGDTIEEVLGYVAYSKVELVSRLRAAVELALDEKRINLDESGRLLRRYEQALSEMTYLNVTDEPVRPVVMTAKPSGPPREEAPDVQPSPIEGAR